MDQENISRFIFISFMKVNEQYKIITDEKYEMDINLLYGVKTNKEFIEKYNDELRSKMRQIHTEMSKTIEPHKRYRLVRKHLSESTKTLATVTALNSLRPNRNRLVAFALSIGTGIKAIGDIIHQKYRFNLETWGLIPQNF